MSKPARGTQRVLPPHPGTQRVLPPHPDADQLRRQARELLRAWQRADHDALARAAPYALQPPPRLAQAQLVIARELGFASWVKLLDEVERRRDAALDDAAFVDRVLALSLGRGYAAPRPTQAFTLLQSRPALRPPAMRLVLGEAVDVDPMQPLPPWNAPPLALVAFSSLARIGHGPMLLASMQRLLAAGADPNGGLVDRDSHPDPDSDPDSDRDSDRDTDPDAEPNPNPGQAARPLPLLYGAVSRSQSGPMVQALLAAGADPNDNESLYHAVEQDDRGMVAALVAAGARWPGTNALFRQLDFDSVPHLRQVLALGADANELSAGTGTRPLHHAVVRGRSLAHLGALLEHGADIAALDGHGHALAWHAARAGRRDVLDWLAPLGQHPPDSLHDRFLAACAAAEEPMARALLAGRPGLIGELAPDQRSLLPEQAQRGALESVRLMLALGWPVDQKGPWDASALNQAAFRGDAAMAALLLQHGARWHERNGYGGTALGSCLHAGCHEPVPGGDYAEVLRLLLADGAPPPVDDEDLTDGLSDVVTAWVDAAAASSGGPAHPSPRDGSANGTS